MKTAITPAQAATWSQWADSANAAVQQLRMSTAAGGSDPMTVEEVDDLLFDAQESTRRLGQAARHAAELPSKRIGDDLDLSRLASMDSPSVRELLAGLSALMPIAERVDAERGNSLSEEIELQPGETRGTDIAEALSLILLRLRRDIEGAHGRD